MQEPVIKCGCIAREEIPPLDASACIVPVAVAKIRAELRTANHLIAKYETKDNQDRPALILLLALERQRKQSLEFALVALGVPQ
jgi:hypothetical protein